MDPIGFALENYDAIGKWRDKDGDSAIDASGKLPDGETFEGPAGLKKLLLASYRDDFVAHGHGKASDLRHWARAGGLRSCPQFALS